MYSASMTLSCYRVHENREHLLQGYSGWNGSPLELQLHQVGIRTALKQSYITDTTYIPDDTWVGIEHQFQYLVGYISVIINLFPLFLGHTADCIVTITKS